jgi:hypothetical protein
VSKNALSKRDVILIFRIARWHAVLHVNSNSGHGLAAKSEKPAAVKFSENAKQYDLAIDELGWKAINLPFKVAHRVFNQIPESVWTARRTSANNPPLWDPELAEHVRKLIVSLTSDYVRLTSGYGNAASGVILNNIFIEQGYQHV